MRDTTTKTRKQARAARTARATAYRTRFVKLDAKAARTARVATLARQAREALDAELARLPRVRDEDLTREQRDAINEALREFLANRFSGEVGYDGDIEVAYHAEFPLASAWLLFSATEAPEVDAVFDRLGIVIDPAHWDDGWSEYRETWSVRCTECGAVHFGVPGGDIGQLPTRGTWPDGKCDCGAPLTKPHYTEIVGGDTAWWADCTCGWGADGPTYKTRAAAKGQITRHLKSVDAAQAA
jgi:hypothetical protein